MFFNLTDFEKNLYSEIVQLEILSKELGICEDCEIDSLDCLIHDGISSSLLCRKKYFEHYLEKYFTLKNMNSLPVQRGLF